MIVDCITIITAPSNGAHTSGDTLQHDSAPDTRPMPALGVAGLVDPEASPRVPYFDDGEPTIAEAANLLARINGSGAVARLDLLHDALMTTHRRGRAAEHRALESIADAARRAFGEAVRDRALEVEQAAGVPWSQRVRAQR